jgi:Iron/zinc purple acid phosphatase-like protein C
MHAYTAAALALMCCFCFCFLVQAGLEKLFYDNHVAMAYAGHVHAYERTKPMYNFAAVEGGVTYITIGDAGNREGHAGKFLDQTDTPWSVYRCTHITLYCPYIYIVKTIQFYTPM